MHTFLLYSPNLLPSFFITVASSLSLIVSSSPFHLPLPPSYPPLQIAFVLLANKLDVDGANDNVPVAEKVRVCVSVLVQLPRTLLQGGPGLS